MLSSNRKSFVVDESQVIRFFSFLLRSFQGSKKAFALHIQQKEKSTRYTRRHKRRGICLSTSSISHGIYHMGNLFRKHGEVYKTLTNETLERCRSITGFTDEEIHNEHQKFFSVADDGRLKKSHMEDLIGDYLPRTKHKHPRYLTNCVFSAIDTNNDGYIDFIEYLMSIKFFQTDSPIEKADFVFRIIDKNGDHLVTQKELERILKCLKEYHQSLTDVRVTDVIHDGSKPAAQTIIQKLDEDKSGKIGVSEFVDAWLKDDTIRVLFTF